MRLTTSMAVFVAAFLLSQSAQARTHHSHSRVVRHDAGSRAYAYAPPEGHYGYGGRPAAWCGWEMTTPSRSGSGWSNPLTGGNGS